MKKCPHCGKELPQEMQFCPYCMEKLIPETPVGEVFPRRHHRWWLWLAAALLILLLLWGLWLWRPWRGSAPAEESGALPFSEVTTTTTTADALASTTTPASQTNTITTQGSADVPHTTTTGNVTAPHTTTAAGGTALQTGTTSRTTAATTSRTTAATTSAATDPCARGHDWEPITETVQVEEEGHYETKMVEKRVTVYRCALCYKEHLALDDYYAHFDAEHGGDALQGIFRDRYTETTEYRQVEEKTWVVDTPAHNKTVTVGRRCRVCGKTETDDDKE